MKLTSSDVFGICLFGAFAFMSFAGYSQKNEGLLILGLFVVFLYATGGAIEWFAKSDLTHDKNIEQRSN